MPPHTPGDTSVPDPDDRWIDYLPLEDIRGAEHNPRHHDGAGIQRAIRQHGMGEPPMLDERTGRLVAGHGRIEQLILLHDTGQRPQGVRLDDQGRWLVPIVRGWRSESDAQAAAYLVGSNELTTRGFWDDRGLVDLLEELDRANMLEVTGFSHDQLDDRIASLQELELPLPLPEPEPEPSGERDVPARRTGSLDDRQRAYEHAGTHAVILAFPNDTYRWVVEQLAALGESLGVDSNSGTVVALIAEATGNTPPGGA
jgi:hypothetical protein